MRQSSKTSSLVAEARMPSLGSFLPRLNPGASAGTMKALMPLCVLLGIGHGEEHHEIGYRAGLVTQDLRPFKK